MSDFHHLCFELPTKNQLVPAKKAWYGCHHGKNQLSPVNASKRQGVLKVVALSICFNFQ